MPTTFPQLVDVETAAALLAVDVRYMRRLVTERRIPHTKVGKFLRFDVADLEALVAAGRREAVAR